MADLNEEIYQQLMSDPERAKRYVAAPPVALLSEPAPNRQLSPLMKTETAPAGETDQRRGFNILATRGVMSKFVTERFTSQKERTS